jgi:hypothetical protein
MPVSVGLHEWKKSMVQRLTLNFHHSLWQQSDWEDRNFAAGTQEGLHAKGTTIDSAKLSASLEALRGSNC